MIENTVFSEKELKNVVRIKYNIYVTEIKRINRGSANLYSINNNTYVLKEFQSKYTNEEINREIVVINHLKNDNLSVPEYITTIDNEYSFSYKGKIITMQKFIDGYTVESNTGTYEQILESASMLGKIVNSLKTLEIELPIVDVSTWFSLETIENAINKHKKLLEKIMNSDEFEIVDGLKDKISMLEYVRDNFIFDDMMKLTILNTHGDYSVLQFIYKNEKINSVIDFVSACKMPVVWEVIRSYSYIDLKAKDGKIDIDNLTDYVKEFNKYIKLNKYDVKYMAYLYLIQLLTSTFGYKQYIEDNSKKELLDFALFRTKLSRFLFDNASTIGKCLENKIVSE